MTENSALALFTQRLQALNPVNIDLHDDSEAHKNHPGAASGGGHYQLRIISEAFTAMNRLQRHRLVYNYLSDLIPTRIHALNIEALTPQEWLEKSKRGMSRNTDF